MEPDAGRRRAAERGGSGVGAGWECGWERGGRELRRYCTGLTLASTAAANPLLATTTTTG